MIKFIKNNNKKMNYNYDPQKIRVLPNDGLKLLVSDGSSSNYEINEIPIIDESGTKAHFRLVTPDDSKIVLWQTKVGKGLEKWLKSFDEFKDVMIKRKLYANYIYIYKLIFIFNLILFYFYNHSKKIKLPCQKFLKVTYYMNI